MQTSVGSETLCSNLLVDGRTKNLVGANMGVYAARRMVEREGRGMGLEGGGALRSDRSCCSWSRCIHCHPCFISLLYPRFGWPKNPFLARQ